MRVRNEKYNWTDDALNCSKQIKKALQPILEKYRNEFSYEDLFYLVCTEFNKMIMLEILDRKVEKNRTIEVKG